MGTTASNQGAQIFCIYLGQAITSDLWVPEALASGVTCFLANSISGLHLPIGILAIFYMIIQYFLTIYI